MKTARKSTIFTFTRHVAPAVLAVLACLGSSAAFAGKPAVSASNVLLVDAPYELVFIDLETGGHCIFNPYASNCQEHDVVFSVNPDWGVYAFANPLSGSTIKRTAVPRNIRFDEVDAQFLGMLNIKFTRASH